MADAQSIPGSRICTKCGVDKPLRQFSKAGGGKYGLSSRCRACAGAYARANRGRMNELSLARYHRLQEPKRKEKAEAKLLRLACPSKRCPRCSTVKPKSQFGVQRSSLDGLKPYCRMCHNACNKDVRERKPESASRWSRIWRSNNREDCRAHYQRWRSRPHNRIHLAVGARIYASLADGKMGMTTEEILGYSFKELKVHLEKQFQDGMSWSNYGEWHIDHITPLVLFPVASPIDPNIRSAWALPNLRPLWAVENLKKNRTRTHLI